MKKFWKIIGILFLIVVILFTVALIGGFIFLKNFDIAKYKPQIIQKASEALGRPVDFKNIDLKVSLREGVRFQLLDFSIGENPEFGGEAFVSAGEINAGLDILSFLTARQIAVPNILVRSPRINIVRNEKGILNVQTLAPLSAATPAQGQTTPAGAAALPAIFIDSLKISDAELHYIDQSLNPAQKVSVTQLNLDVLKFSLINPFDVLLDAAVLSAQTDLRVKSTIQLALTKKEAKVTDLDIFADLSQLSLDQLKGLSVLDGVPVPQVLKGQLKATIKEAVLSDKGLGAFVMDFSFTDGQVAAADIIPGISVTANKINVDVKNFSFKDAFDVTASLGYESDVPNILMNGTLAFDPSTQNVHVSRADIKTDLSKIPFARLKETLAPLKTVPLPEVLRGQLDIVVKELSAGPKGLLTVTADAALQEGAISMKEVSPGVSFAASNIDADIKGFGLGTPFKFSVGLAYLHDLPNIQAEGTATINMEGQSVQLEDATVETDLSTFAMDELQSSIAALKDVPLPEDLQGRFSFTISEAVAGVQGLSKLTSQGSLKDGEVKLKELAVPISILDAQFRLTEKDFSTDTVRANLGQGEVAAKVGVTDYLSVQGFNVSAELKAIDLKEILDQAQAPVKIEGLAFGTFKAQGQGSDTDSITGSGEFEVREAKLKDLNVLKTVLDKISFLPDVTARVEASLPEKYKEKLQDKDTDINKISTVVTIAQGTATLDPVSIEADEFIFSGNSQVGFDQAYSLDGAVKIPAELSSAMVQGVAEMQYLFDQDQNISLPVHVSGKGAERPSISVTQTAIDMGKNAMINEGIKQLERIFDNNSDEEQAPASPEGQQQQPESAPQEEEPSPEAQIIGDILENIFK